MNGFNKNVIVIMITKKRQVKFYADTPMQINRRFTWRINHKQDAEQAIKRFQSKGWRIRAAWYEDERLI